MVAMGKERTSPQSVQQFNCRASYHLMQEFEIYLQF